MSQEQPMTDTKAGGGEARDEAFQIWCNPEQRKPSAYQLHYHAFIQGLHAGYQGANHKQGCPYRTPDYVAWWKHGCLAAEPVRKCRQFIAAIQADKQRLETRVDELTRLLRPCAVNSTEATGVEGTDIPALAKAMEVPIEEVPEHVNSMFADLECRAAQGEADKQRLEAELDEAIKAELERVNAFARTLGYGQGELDEDLSGCLAKSFDQLRQENERLRVRLLSAAGDDLCRLSQDEIKELSSGAVKIPPKEEFLASCERFHAQIAGEAGVLGNCLTLAQLIAENERLRREVAASKVSDADLRKVEVDREPMD